MEKENGQLTLTVRETARLLGVCKSSLYAAIRMGQVPSVRVGRRLLVPKIRLEKLMNGEDINNKLDMK